MPDIATPTPPSLFDSVTLAVLALQGYVLSDFHIPTPGNLLDISKISELVSNTIEARIPEWLNARRQIWDDQEKFAGYEFTKAKAGYPDVRLTNRTDSTDVKFRIEVKSWYVLSRDALTARFRTHPSYLLDDDMLVVAAWTLDGIVNGSPKLIRLFIDRALPIAMKRDQAWSTSGNRKVEAPSNPPGTAPNLIQTSSVAYTLRNNAWVAEAKNFGKLDRLGWDPLRKFSETVLSLEVAGRSLDAWRQFITRTPAPSANEDAEPDE